MYRANNASNVVNEVIRVLESVWFIDRLRRSEKCDSFFARFSLILSKTTTVSLIEYPAIVRIAAIEAKFNLSKREKAYRRKNIVK